MTANQPPSPTPSPPPPSGKRKGPLIAVIGVIALAAIGVGIMQGVKKPGPTANGTTSTGQTSQSGAFSERPQVGYAELESAPRQETPELFWLNVVAPKVAHETLRKNAWLGKALKDPVGQGFIAAWGGFFGTRGEDLGDVFAGAVGDLVLDQVLSSPYRIVWYGGDGAKGAPAIVVSAPTPAATRAFDTLVRVAASGGFNPPSCVASVAADGGATGESIHRIVLADKIIFAARLGDRLVLAPRPQAAMLAMCKPLPASEPNDGVVVSLGFSISESGRGAQGLGTMLGIKSLVTLAFGVDATGFVPKSMDLMGDGSRLAAVEPSAELLKAIPAKSGVVLFLAVKLPQDLSATALRDTFGIETENFGKTRKVWPSGAPRQIAVVWNPRGNRNTEVAVLWAQPGDEKPLAEAMTNGNGALVAGKACSVLAFTSTKELMTDLQASCSGKQPSMLQAAQPIAKGLSQNAALSFTVNFGQVMQQLTIDGWLSEHPAPNVTTGPQEIEAARKLLEELPTVGFRATIGSDGKIVSGGFKS
jgi:hypothetical protein